MHMSAQKIYPNKPFVILLYGFPGSGKTTFARQLAEEISVAHVQHDRLTTELYGNNTPENAKLGRNAVNYMTREFLRAGVSVIYDADVHRMSERRVMRDMVRKFKATPILIWLQIDAETAYGRTQKRDRRKAEDHFAKDYTVESFQNLLRRMQNPDNEEDFTVISGKHTFHTQRAAVKKKFYEAGVLTPNQLSQNMAKPGLVNLVPQTLGGRADISRRNINIRQ